MNKEKIIIVGKFAQRSTMTHIVSYDLNGEKDYDRINTGIKSAFPISEKTDLTTLWFVRAPGKSSNEINRTLRQFVDSTDELFVAAISDFATS